MLKNIFVKAKENTFFRQVLETGKQTQIVIMSIAIGEDIGEEVHADSDQILMNISGTGEVVLDGNSMPFEENDVVLVNAGTKHNFINKGNNDLKIITTYSPPHHPQGTIHKTKEEAMRAEY